MFDSPRASRGGIQRRQAEGKALARRVILIAAAVGAIVFGVVVLAKFFPEPFANILPAHDRLPELLSNDDATVFIHSQITQRPSLRSVEAVPAAQPSPPPLDPLPAEPQPQPVPKPTKPPRDSALEKWWSSQQLPKLPPCADHRSDKATGWSIFSKVDGILADASRDAEVLAAEGNRHQAACLLRDAAEECHRHFKAYGGVHSSSIDPIDQFSMKLEDLIGQAYYESAKRAASNDDWNGVLQRFGQLNLNAPYSRGQRETKYMLDGHIKYLEKIRDPSATSLRQRFDWSLREHSDSLRKRNNR